VDRARYHGRVLPPSEEKVCPICNGTGWKPVEASNGDSPVARCDCWRDSITRRLLGDARIPRRYHHCTLNDFITYDNETLEEALARARTLAEAFPVVDRGLFFLGAPGVGKTHLAAAVLKQVVLTRGARGLFYDTRDLLKVIRGTYNAVVKTTELEVLRPVMEADLLVLDDLGAEKTSEWVEETLNLIVNTRYNERRLTIFTSNYPDVPPDSDADVISLHDRIGFRMRSRLHEMCDFLDLEGADYRMLLPNEGPAALKRNWEERQMHGKPEHSARVNRQAKAQLRGGDGKADLKWPGGRAGSK
jgi:DNA replication protein DnaC